jgi:dephospho-CoA kinase
VIKKISNNNYFAQNELKKLNKLMWPVILDETKNKVDKLYKEGFDVIVIEAAVLIQAGWQPICHEIWTCIIPQEEVSIVIY